MFSGILLLVIAMALLVFAIIRFKSLSRYHFVILFVLMAIAIAGGLILILLS